MTRERRAYRVYGSGQVADAYVLKRFLFMRLIQFDVRVSWDGSPPFRYYTKICWRPVWRLF